MIYEAIKIFKLFFQLHDIRKNLGPVDRYIATIRSTLKALESFGIKLAYFRLTLKQIENGKERFMDLSTDFERKFAEVKFPAQVGIKV